jgi:hemerythrin-like domain-containing protein
MCNYCGCRSIEPIAELTAEHEQIVNMSGEIRRAVARGEHRAAVGVLQDLRQVLRMHDAVEELAVYPAMARHPEYTDKVGTLFDEHDDLDAVVDGALAVAETSGPESADWPAVLHSLEALKEHIDHEEHGLFPAAAVSLDPEDWDAATAVRAAHGNRHGHAHPHDHSHEHGD